MRKAEKLPTISVDNLPDLFLGSNRFSMAVVVSFMDIQRSGGDRGMTRIFLYRLERRTSVQLMSDRRVA